MNKCSKSLICIMVLLLSLSIAIVGCQTQNRQARLTREGQQYVDRQRDFVSNNQFFNDGSRIPNDYTDNNTPGYRNNDVARNYENQRLGNTSDPILGNNTMASTTRKIYDRLAALSGVNDSTVVITGNTAVVGVDVNENARGEVTNNIKTKVEKAVRAADTDIKNVVVTADPDLFKRIKRVGQDVIDGRPLKNFGTEMEEIMRRINPR